MEIFGLVDDDNLIAYQNLKKKPSMAKRESELLLEIATADSAEYTEI